MSTNLARYLKDFSVPETAPVSFGDGDLSFGDTDLDDAFPMLEEPEPVDIDRERREAYAEGHEAATTELTEIHSAAIAEMERIQNERIAELEARHAKAMAETLADGLKKITADIALSVSEQVAVALAPLFSAQVAENAVAELARLIEVEILAGHAGTIVVRGPANLFERLKDALPDAEEILRHIEVDDLDLSAEMGEGVIVTRISAWADSLEKVTR